MKERLVLRKEIKKALNKLLLSIIIFLIGMILVKTKYKETIKTKFYEESLPFQKLKNTYNKYLGNIIEVEKTQEVFNETLSYTNISKYKDGVKLKVSNNYMVPILESGVVVFIGEKEDYKNTIIVEQTNGIDVFYGNIKGNNIKLYDYVEKGELLGETINNELYLVFQKDGAYLDYKEYI
ncbi:MAG: M23 family metallopeptidase [Bacilli bacterium]|nr:M23 family metallopeptidase [Bacilli bacterium]